MCVTPTQFLLEHCLVFDILLNICYLQLAFPIGTEAFLPVPGNMQLAFPVETEAFSPVSGNQIPFSLVP